MKFNSQRIGISLIAGILWHSATANAPEPTQAGNPFVYINQGKLVIRETGLIDQVVDEALSILDAHPEIKQLWLIDIPGGFSVPSARLAWRAETMDVVIAGGCYSACANVALSGQTLRVAPWHGALPSALAIHGSFLRTGEWSPQGLNNLRRYAERLTPIESHDIEAALSFPFQSAAGLFIFTDGSVAEAKGRDVLLCEHSPVKCRAIDVTLDQLRILKTDLVVPPRATATPSEQRAP